MYLKLDESKWYRHTQEWSDRSKGLGRVDVYKGQIEVAENVALVVHAHWIFYANGTCDCSNCHTVWESNMLNRWIEYCPFCGAKMDEEVK